LGQLLKKTAKSLAIAESCTGGYISHLVTSVPGSSAYFKGSVIAYANEVKEESLQVSPESIAKHGAVSKEVVAEMAKNIRTKYNSDYAIATSGIAGPDGGSAEKPVGTTWIAVASKNIVIPICFNFGEERSRNIQKAAITALNMLRKLVIKENGA